MKTIYNYLQKGVGSNWRTTGFFSFLVLFMCFTLTGYAQTSTNLPGPYDVDNPDTSPVTVNVNDAANTTGFSELIYDSFQVTADWDETSGGAWSSEAGIEVVTSAGTVTVNPATSGSFDDGFSTTLIFEGDFAGSYDPATDGTLDLILNQSFGGSSADWSNITVTLFEPLPPLTNDDFADATAVVCSGNYIGSTVDATLDESDAPTNNADMDAPNVWFSYTGSGVAEFVTLDLCDSSYDTSLLVFTGTSGNLTLVEDNDDFCDLQSQLTFTSDGSTTYFIAVEGWNSSSVGNYDLDVTCELVPTCLEPNNLTASNITSSSTDLSWDAEATASFGYEWVVMNAGDAPAVDGSEVATGSVVSTMSMDSVSGLNSATAYDAYVRSICGIGDFSDWSSAESFTTLLDFCAGDNFIDSGGLSGNYSNNENITTTISPENSGDVVSVEFLSFNTESGFDYLFIYDGPDTFSPVISSGSSNDGWNGTGSFSAEGETFISTHPSGSLTFLFTSDISSTRSGWEADVTCGPPPSCLAPTNLTTSNITGNSVDLAWDAEATASFGYQWVVMNAGDAPAVDGSEVVTGTEASGDLMASVTGLNSATAYDAYVRSICGIGDFSDWSDVASFTTLPDYCAGDNFIDSGGLSGNYSNNENITTTISPENSGDVVYVEFLSFDTESSFDYLFIYDGPDTSSPVISSGSSNDGWNGTGSFSAEGETFISTHPSGSLTFVFTSDNSATRSGWEADVTCGPPPSCLAPTNLTTSNITGNSVDLAWDAEATASFGYEWVVMNAGDAPAVDGSEVATGMEASGDLMASVTGLSSITDYDAYVRSICGIGDFSDWSSAESFTTIIANDDCAGALPATVTPNGDLSQPITFDTTNAQDANVIPSCEGFDSTESDLWYEFTTNSTEGIILALLSGDVNDIEGAIYDSCGGAELFCFADGASVDFNEDVLVTGLMANTTYYLQVYAESFVAGSFSLSLTDLPSCIPPENLSASNVTATTTDLSWDAQTTASFGYEWVIMNAGDAPAVDGSEVATGMEASGDLMASVTGLSSITDYDAYVRSICGIGDFSDWSDVASFTTLPDYCAGDNFIDSGGLSGNYSNNENITTTISPENSGDVVYVEFLSFDTESSFDYLFIYDGPDTSSPVISSGSSNDGWNGTGSFSAEGETFISTHPSGSLTFVFTSDNSATRSGWEADVTCGPPPSCLAPTNLTTSNITGNSVDLAWDAEATASFGYEWVVMNAGDAPAVDGSEVATGMEASGDLMASVTGLSSITDYDAYVRSICGIGDFSDWSSAESFTTIIANDDCAGALPATVTPNGDLSQPITFDTTNAQDANVIPSCEGFDSTESDLWYEFTTNSTEGIILALLSGDVNDIEGAIYDSCGGAELFCFADGASVDFNEDVLVTGLMANTTYYLQVYAESFVAGSFSLSLTDLPSCIPPENLSASNVTATTTDLSWDAQTTASFGYEWVIMNAGDAPAVDGSEVATGMEASGDLMASVTGLSSITDYDAYVRSICGIGDFSDWSDVASFTTLPDFCAGDNFVDSGGLSGNYSNNENITTTISPENSGDVVSVEFLSFNTELNYDGLLIYDGPDTSSPSIDSGYVPTQSFHDAPTGSWNGTGSFSAQGETFTSTHPSGSLTFVFTSDGSATRSGWEASVSCFTPPTLAFQEVFTDNRAALSSSVAFNDVDGDNDQDFIITGSTQRNQFGPSGGQISRLYKNNGTGNFGAPVSGTPFMGLSYSSLSFSDVNQDGIKDVVSAGEDYSTGINYVKYYSSDGTGSFTETTGTPFPPNMKRVDFKIADFDNDGVNDILLIGVASNGTPSSPRLFENRGTEMNPDYFNRFSPSPLPRVSKGSIAVADIDGDSDLDIFISGKLRNGNKISRLYRNEGNFQFTEITGTGLDQVDSGDSAFADVDDDGDEDLLISGLDSADNNVLKLYLNDGTGVFTEAIAAINIPSMWLLEAFDFADVDGDTDQDVLLTGYNPANYQRITTMWENLLYSSRRPNTGDTSGFNIDMDDEENDLSFGAGFKLVPNPTGLGFTNIIMPDVSGEVEVIINDVLGRAVSSQSMTITNNRIELDTKDLSSGVYVISLRKGKSTFTTKLIVE